MVITKPSKHVRSHLCLLQPAIAPPQAAFVFSHSRQELCCVPSGRALRQDARSRRRFHPFRVTPQPLALNYNNLSPDELLTLRRLIEKAAGESAGELDGATDERSPARRRRSDGPRPWLHRLRSGRECPANGGSSGVGQPLVLVGMRLESVAQSRAERSIVDRAANLKQEIGTSSGPAHLLRLVHSPIDEKVCGSF